MLHILILLTLAIVSTALWYGFFYHLLFSIKNKVDIKKAALKLLVLVSFAISTCPFVVSMVLKHKNCSKMMMKMMHSQEKTSKRR